MTRRLCAGEAGAGFGLATVAIGRSGRMVTAPRGPLDMLRPIAGPAHLLVMRDTSASPRDYRAHLNNGVFMIQSSCWSAQFLDSWAMYALRMRGCYQDQGPFMAAVVSQTNQERQDRSDGSGRVVQNLSKCAGEWSGRPGDFFRCLQIVGMNASQHAPYHSKVRLLDGWNDEPRHGGLQCGKIRVPAACRHDSFIHHFAGGTKNDMIGAPETQRKFVTHACRGFFASEDAKRRPHL